MNGRTWPSVSPKKRKSFEPFIDITDSCNAESMKRTGTLFLLFMTLAACICNGSALPIMARQATTLRWRDARLERPPDAQSSKARPKSERGQSLSGLDYSGKKTVFSKNTISDTVPERESNRMASDKIIFNSTDNLSEIVSDKSIAGELIYTPLSSSLNLGFIVGLMCVVVTLMVVVEHVDVEEVGNSGRTCRFMYLPNQCKRWPERTKESEIIAPLMQWLNWRFSLLKLCHTGDIIIIFMPVFRPKLQTKLDAWIFPLNHIVLVSWYVLGVVLLRRHGDELSFSTRKNAKYGLICSLFAESLMLLYLFYYGKDFPWREWLVESHEFVIVLELRTKYSVKL